MATQDTEITLGTGKMLGIFFALVTLCGVFFGLGYSLGRSGRNLLADSDQPQNSPALRPSASKSTTGAPTQTGEGLTFYKAVEQKDPNAQLPTDAAKDVSKEAPKDTAKEVVTPDRADTDSKQSQPAAPDPATALASASYFVQVAAVTKEEDAKALVDALQRKQYAAFTASSPTDKLLHVQIGPFNDVKEAEATRAKLIGDGYNPILKK